MMHFSNTKPIIERRSNKERRVNESRREEIRWEPDSKQRRKILDRRKDNMTWTDKLS